jgi:(2R)-3-sulfolactate dehydrogenase (NADP+)
MVCNTPQAMAAWGGAAPLYGTNPIAFAAPREGPPLVIDLSLSLVARGKVMAAAQRGEPIPQGWALDADGNATTDAEAALKGTMVPAGGAKGAALALMVEVLSATLTGANPSREASSFFDADGPPPGVGHLAIAIDPDAAAAGFVPRMEALAAAIEAEPGARVPGSGRIARRAAAQAEGISAAKATVDRIRSIAEG